MDMLYCGVRYMAGYTDYELFGFCALDKSQRKTYVTRGVNNRYVRTLNEHGRVKDVDDKFRMHEVFSSYINRNWCDLRKVSPAFFSAFVKENGSIMVKPADARCGKGVEKITFDGKTDYAALYHRLISNRQFLAEGCVVQHPDLSKLYPDAVNTLRVVSVTKTACLILSTPAFAWGAGAQTLTILIMAACLQPLMKTGGC